MSSPHIGHSPTSFPVHPITLFDEYVSLVCARYGICPEFDLSPPPPLAPLSSSPSSSLPVSEFISTMDFFLLSLKGGSHLLTSTCALLDSATVVSPTPPVKYHPPILKYVSTSNRVCYTVESSASTARKAKRYVVLPNYCSCPSFYHSSARVKGGRPAASSSSSSARGRDDAEAAEQEAPFCKHQLAVRVCAVLERLLEDQGGGGGGGNSRFVEVVKVTDEGFAILLKQDDGGRM